MLETVCEVREVKRCEEVQEEECSLVDEVVRECREVERQEGRLKEQECSSVEREQCWLGPVGWQVSLLIGPETILPRMGSVLANRAGHYIY